MHCLHSVVNSALPPWSSDSFESFPCGESVVLIRRAPGPPRAAARQLAPGGATPIRYPLLDAPWLLSPWESAHRAGVIRACYPMLIPMNLCASAVFHELAGADLLSLSKRVKKSERH
jgi:hypothetical protein